MEIKINKAAELKTKPDQKQLGFGMVSDERFCDGLYLSRSLRQMRKLMKNPALMEVPLEKKVEDID